MATIPVNLYVNGPYPPSDPLAPGRLIRSPSSSLPAILPPAVAGDTWAIKLYYYLGTGEPSNPFFNYRFPGSSTRVRFRTPGNGLIYATAVNGSEIGAGTAPTVTRVQAGGENQIEKQKVDFDANTGSFRLTFYVPPQPASGNSYYSIFGSGTTSPIPAGATASEIENIINNGIVWWKITYLSSAGVWSGTWTTTGGPYDAAHIPTPNGFPLVRVTDWVQYKSFTLNFGILFQSSPPGAPYDGKNTWPWLMPLVSVDASALNATWGWNVNLVLDGNGHTFNDLFLPANKPALLEVLLTKAGETEQLASQTVIASSDDPPVILNGPPPDGLIGTAYSFTYFATGYPTFSVSSGVLPPGLSLNASTGEISGTPTTAGTYVGTINASNVGGSTVASFSIVIPSAPAPPTPDPHDPMAVKLDGDYSLVESTDIPYPEYFEQWRGLIVWHQPLTLLVSAAGSPALGASGPLGYFWKDTPWRSLGGNVVAFERLWHNIPSDFNEPVAISKDYQAGDYTFVNGQLSDIAIISFSRAIKADCNYHYALDDPGTLPTKPFIQIIPFLHGQAITDLSTGFPRALFNGQSLYNNNYGSSFITGSIEKVLGRLYCKKTITG